MASLYVRTSSAGTGPLVNIQDLGLPVPTSATWTLLNASDPESALGSNGQFSGRRIRDSQDLFDAIRAGDLEWSKDGSTVELPADYVADYALLQDLTDDELDLENGAFLLPRSNDHSDIPREGALHFDRSEQQLYIGSINGWEGIEMAAPRVVLVDEVPGSKHTYIGEAAPGTSVTASGWRIYRLDESKPGDEEIIKLYANDSTSFDQSWSNRLTLTYNLPA